jgi:hypothetical protein
VASCATDPGCTRRGGRRRKPESGTAARKEGLSGLGGCDHASRQRRGYTASLHRFVSRLSQRICTQGPSRGCVHARKRALRTIPDARAVSCAVCTRREERGSGAERAHEARLPRRLHAEERPFRAGERYGRAGQDGLRRDTGPVLIQRQDAALERAVPASAGFNLRHRQIRRRTRRHGPAASNASRGLGSASRRKFCRRRGGIEVAQRAAHALYEHSLSLL